MARSKLYNSWSNMKSRIKRPYVKGNQCYKGLSYSPCFEKFKNFERWALNNGYKEGLSIDRIDNNLGYSPTNCRWITLKEQQRNKKNNKLYTYNGKTQCIQAWEEEYGLTKDLLKCRLRRGWDFKKSLLTTSEQGNKLRIESSKNRKRDEKGRFYK